MSVPVTCERGALTVAMSVDGAGMLQGLRISSDGHRRRGRRHPTPTRRRFEEREVTIGSGALAVPGTFSLPRGRGPHPGVVLLSGGGPFDRDETSGPNKPLKDLAWGLASRGVAVVRFDKVTFAHASQVADAPDFTMTDEYVPHAVAAVHLLQRQPNVDPARVFVLGHSMGGKVAPRVAAAEPSVAGLVILAADAEPMQHAAIRVARYLAALNPGPDCGGRRQGDYTAGRDGRQSCLVAVYAWQRITLWPLRRRIGLTCETTTRSLLLRRWANRCSSSRVAATIK